MFHLDHFAMYSRNYARTTFQISQETGFGAFDGGFFPTYGLGIRIIPLGPDLFLEIESLIDWDVIRHALATDHPYIKVAMAHPEAFAGCCFRCDTLEELEEFAKRRGVEVNRTELGEANAQQMMNGDKNVVLMAPVATASWPAGMPNVYYWPDMSKHDSRYPVERGTQRIQPKGLAWVELGGTAEIFDDWFAGLTTAADHPVRFNGRAPGLYALAIDTDAGEVVIRRPSITEPPLA